VPDSGAGPSSICTHDLIESGAELAQRSDRRRLRSTSIQLDRGHPRGICPLDVGLGVVADVGDVTHGDRQAPGGRLEDRPRRLGRADGGGPHDGFERRAEPEPIEESRQATVEIGHDADAQAAPTDVVERCRPVFATYADPIVHLGSLGSGQVTKILNNLLFTANLGSALTTLDLGESLGIPRARLAEVLNGGSAVSKALGSIAMFGGTVEALAPIAGGLLQKDVRHAANIAATASAPEGAVFTAADAALQAMDHPR